MAIITNKPDVKTTWASGGSVTQPSTTKKLQGWVAEIPPYQIANAIEFNQDTAIKYLFQEGVSEWDSTFEYSATSWVKFNKNLYRAKRANINKQPNNNAADWEIPYLLSSDVQPLVNNKVDKTTKIVAGTGLSGGGDLSTDRTLNIDTAYSPATSMNLVALDLNTITTAGFYYQPYSTQATTARNYPINTAGALIVTVTLSSGINQEYTTYGSNIRRYIRSYYGGVWSDWVEVLTSLRFGAGSGFVAQGNDSRINNGQTAYSWGNHASAGYVKNTGNETVNGVKTFTSFLVTPSTNPTSAYQVANKKYVDDKIASGNYVEYYSDYGGTLTVYNNNVTGARRVSFHAGTPVESYFFDANVNFGTVLKGNNGYTTLPNGLLLQWGTHTRGDNGGENNVWIDFPKRFNSAPFNVQLTRMTASASGDNSDGGATLHSSTASGISVHLSTYTGASSGSLRGFTWMAIGM